MVITLPLATNVTASMQCYKPADETYQQNPSRDLKVAQMIGLALKPSHHEQPADYPLAGSQTWCCSKTLIDASDCSMAKTHTEGYYHSSNYYFDY